MAVENLKSGSITDLDLVPPLRHVAGSGAGGKIENVQDVITASTAGSVGSTYQMIRLPWTSYLKKLEWWVEATVTTFAGDVSLYYSDSTNDGTPKAKQGTIAKSQFAGAAVNMATAAAPADLLYSKLTGDAFNQPLWQAAGLSAEVAGMADVVVVLTSITSGAPVLHMRAEYVVPT